MSVLFLISHACSGEARIDKLSLPAGFKVEYYVQNVRGARSMCWGNKGTLFVSSREAGKVYAITPDRKIITLATDKNMPNGVAFRNGDLYVAEIDRVWKLENIEDHLLSPPAAKMIVTDLPKEVHHGWKFISFGPDGKLYVPVGAPCNICEVKDPYASIARMDPDGKNREIVARGLRNSVGFDWHPLTKELWFTDNGRDMMGDDIPSDELNRVTKIGLHFGYPFCHQGDLLDPDFGKSKSCKSYTAPEAKLGPHVAALGMRFYTGKMFPAEYKNQIFIAEHGSWNRSKKSGYQVVVAQLGKDGHIEKVKPFIEGWLENESSWGRPVDILVAPDGALLVSDDQADAIYRISYHPP